MGKIRVAALGDEQQEKEQRKKAEARREAKKAKKDKPEEETAAAQTVAPETEAEQTGKEKKEKAEAEATARPKTRSKRYQEVAGLVDKNTLYPMTEAVQLLKKTSLSKFDGTVELHLNLNKAVLGDKADFRSTVTLPHGTGKEVKVAIADEELIKEIEAGKITFDILVAHPSLMPKLARVARVLGPKGLMPNPKNGTVTDEPEKRAKELSGGKVNFKSEPGNPIVHLSVGKVSFDDQKLAENIKAVLDNVGTGKIVKATVSATMGPGIRLQV